MYNMAKNIHEKMGGTSVTAKATGVSLQTSYRWTYPKDKGGTDGVIPFQYHQKIYDFAVANDKPLDLDDFLVVETRT